MDSVYLSCLHEYLHSSAIPYDLFIFFLIHADCVLVKLFNFSNVNQGEKSEWALWGKNNKEYNWEKGKNEYILNVAEHARL